MAKRKAAAGASGSTNLSARERHKKFVRENGEWNTKVEKSLSKLERLGSDESPAPAKT
jgi:hypothetical protein